MKFFYTICKIKGFGVVSTDCVEKTQIWGVGPQIAQRKHRFWGWDHRLRRGNTDLGFGTTDCAEETQIWGLGPQIAQRKHRFGVCDHRLRRGNTDLGGCEHRLRGENTDLGVF